MNWARAIERNSEALTRIVAALFAMLGLASGGTVGRIERHLHRAVLRVLWPAEAAVRRLIVIAARGLVVKPAPSRPMPKDRVIKRGTGTRNVFQLFDPRKRFLLEPRRKGPRPNPRITFMSSNAWGDPVFSSWQARPTPAPKPDDGLIDATRLRRRLEAVKLALEDLPGQARRLVRARARREKVPRLRSQSPLRPGRPPGHRKKPTHEVDEVLKECHGLAWDALALDTS